MLLLARSLYYLCQVYQYECTYTTYLNNGAMIFNLSAESDPETGTSCVRPLTRALMLSRY